MAASSSRRKLIDTVSSFFHSSCLWLGLVIGINLTLVFNNIYQHHATNFSPQLNLQLSHHKLNQYAFLEESNRNVKSGLASSMSDAPNIDKQFFANIAHQKDVETEEQELHHAVNPLLLDRKLVAQNKVLCAIKVLQQHSHIKQIVLDSYGLRCDQLFFFVFGKDTYPNSNATTFVVKGENSIPWDIDRHSIISFNDIKSIFATLLKEAAADINWFILTDASAYLIVENLRSSLIHSLDVTKPQVAGKVVKKGAGRGYLDDMAIVVNRLGINSLQEALSKDPPPSSLVPLKHGNSLVVWYLRQLKIEPVDLVDEENHDKLIPNYPKLNTLHYKASGEQAVSTEPILFYKNKKLVPTKTKGFFSNMFEYDYLLYRSGVEQGARYTKKSLHSFLRHPHATHNTTAINGQNTF